MESDTEKYQNIINKFIECNELIIKNEEYFKNLKHQNNNDNDQNYYLIDHNLFKKLKENLSYEAFKNSQKSEYEETLKKQIESNSSLLSYNIKKFDKINNFASLLNVLLNNNEIVIINKELWNKICKEGKEEDEGYICIFVGSEINIFFPENFSVNFTHSDNGIITLNSFYNSNKEIIEKIKENEEKLKKIFNSMGEYFIFEKKFRDNIFEKKKVIQEF